MIANGALAYAEPFARMLEPDPDLWVDEWADIYMRIPRGNGAEYGRYRTDRTPFAREVMRCLSPAHSCRRVVGMVASQMMKTQVGLNWAGATVHQAPGNMLVLLPTEKVAKRVSNRFDRTIRDVPELSERFAKPRSRDSRNTIDTKEFDGGTLYITTAGSASNLAEVPIRYVYCDEIDRWEVDLAGEGSPLRLAEARTSTFGHRAKLYYTSTPTEEGASVIAALWDKSDQRRFYVACPHCGERQTLEWERIRWDDALKRAWYVCNSCETEIEEHTKGKLLSGGEWRQTAEGDGETAGFHLNALYAPLGWISWRALAQQYTEAAKALEKGDKAEMQVFYNTRLALTWDNAHERLQADQVRALVEPFAFNLVPSAACVLTAAVDVQKNRLEVLVLGWGEALETWTVAHHVIPGEPTEQTTWNALDSLLLAPVSNVNGVPMVISAAAVDSGNWTQDVYDFVRRRRRRMVGDYRQHVLAVKGSRYPGRAIVATKPSKQDINHGGRVVRQGVELWMVGTDTAKEWLHMRLLTGAGPGAIHYSHQLPDEFFEQLTCEYKRVRYVKGYPVAEWHKPPGARNEALDLMVYNLAMAYHLTLHTHPPAWWDRQRQRLNPPMRDLFNAPPVSQEPAQPEPQREPARRKRTIPGPPPGRPSTLIR